MARLFYVKFYGCKFKNVSKLISHSILFSTFVGATLCGPKNNDRSLWA